MFFLFSLVCIFVCFEAATFSPPEEPTSNHSPLISGINWTCVALVQAADTFSTTQLVLLFILLSHNTGDS